MRIGEFAETTGATTKALRFYEDQGLLPPPERAPSGYRDYPVEMVNRVDFIHRGKAAGLTLAQIRQILDIRDRGRAPCEHVLDLLDTRTAELDRQIAELTELRQTMTGLRDRADKVDPADCRADEVCRYL